jgi:2-polyprenyl-3-methyl-5-hydroxy-6-metoxy-1,4-benzoquinol methylase
MPELSVRQETPPAEDAANKQDYFDRYWITRDFLRTDRRTMERAQLIWSRLTRRAGRALDVGCGRGLFAAFLAEQGLAVEGIDISPQAVELTRGRGIPAFLLDLEHQAPLGAYDIVFCLEVLQQVRDPLAVLRRLEGALAPGGELVVSVPNEFHLARRLAVLSGNADFGGIDDSHLKLFTPARGAELVTRAGLEVHALVHTSIVPPQLTGAARAGRAAAKIWPSGLALSTIYFTHSRTA